MRKPIRVFVSVSIVLFFVATLASVAQLRAVDNGCEISDFTTNPTQLIVGANVYFSITYSCNGVAARDTRYFVSSSEVQNPWVATFGKHSIEARLSWNTASDNMGLHFVSKFLDVDVQPGNSAQTNPTATAMPQPTGTSAPADLGQGGGAVIPTVESNPCPATRWVKVVTEKLNIRSSPALPKKGEADNVIGTAPKGSCFAEIQLVENASGKWHEITLKEGSGYVKASPQYTSSDVTTVTSEATAAPTSTPLPTPTLEVAASSCTSLPPRLEVGKMGQSINDGRPPVNIRSAAGTSNAKVGSVPNAGVFTVLEGPSKCVDGHYWFEVQSGADKGWIAEGDANSYFVQPWMPPQVVPTVTVTTPWPQPIGAVIIGTPEPTAAG